MSSNKSMVGHTLSAAGAVEAVLSLLTLEHHGIPPTINYQMPEPTTCRWTWCRTRRATPRSRNIISNSFGFGGRTSRW